MAIDFSKFDKQFDLEGLKTDVKESSENSFKEVPHGMYEVAITKLELGESSKHDPMFTCWMKVVQGEYNGSLIFMNQVIKQGFQIHIVNEFLRDMAGDLTAIEFESFSQYSALINKVAALIDGKREFAVTYGEKKGFNTFKIEEVFDVE